MGSPIEWIVFYRPGGGGFGNENLREGLGEVDGGGGDFFGGLLGVPARRDKLICRCGGGFYDHPGMVLVPR